MYYFYMGSVLLPISPEKFTMKVKNDNKTLNLINEGEINFLRQAGLTEFEFDALIPSVKYNFAKYDDGFKSPAYFTNHFEKLKTSKSPFQFIVSRQMPNGKMIFDTNMTVSMESYTIKEQVNDGFDLVVSIKLKQYKAFGTKVVKVIENQTSVSENQASVSRNQASVSEQRPVTTNSPAPKHPQLYTTKSGDTLWNISKKTYGTGDYYPVLFEENTDKVTNPNEVEPNQVLTIPTVGTAKTLNKQINEKYKTLANGRRR